MSKRVGSRSGRYGSKGTQTAPETFISLMYNGIAKWSLHQKPGRENESGPDIILSVVQMGRVGSIELTLSEMTEAELLALREFFDNALEWAIPVARRRDSEAEDEFNKGNDGFERVYRAVPAVVYRKELSDEHREGIFDRPENVLEGDESDRSLDRPDGGTGSELVEPDEGDRRSEDSPASPHVPAVLPPLGRTP